MSLNYTETFYELNLKNLGRLSLDDLKSELESVPYGHDWRTVERLLMFYGIKRGIAELIINKIREVVSDWRKNTGSMDSHTIETFTPSLAPGSIFQAYENGLRYRIGEIEKILPDQVLLDFPSIAEKIMQCAKDYYWSW